MAAQVLECHLTKKCIMCILQLPAPASGHNHYRMQTITLVCLLLADRTNSRAYATVLCTSVCDVMYCG